MNKTITVEVRNKVAAQTNRVEYVCGNSDFLIVFDFDDEWADFEVKTARFIYNGTHIDIVFRGNQCAVPVMSDTHKFNVGVYAGDLRTTTAAYIPAKKSILCDAGVPVEPVPDVYNQIMDRVNEVAAEALEPCSWDELQDKPFYDTGYVEVVAEQTVSAIDHEDGIYADLTAVGTLEVGKTYNVKFNDEVYKCAAYHPIDMDDMVANQYTMIGDYSYVSGVFHGLQGESNGEPFVIVQYGTHTTLYVDIDTDYTVSVDIGELVKLDNKYLDMDTVPTYNSEKPVTSGGVAKAIDGFASKEFVNQAIARAEQDDFSGSWNDLKDKPFGVEGAAVVEEQSVETEYADETTLAELSAIGTLEVGKTYIVEFDGASYSCLAYHPVEEWGEGSENVNVILLGDIRCTGDWCMEYDGLNNGEPFAIYQDSVLYLMTNSEGTHTISVFDGKIVTLPDKYLPDNVVKSTAQTLTDEQKEQARKNIGAVTADEVASAQMQADWTQTDEDAPDYIKNKPDIPAAQIQSDWNQYDAAKPDYIKNRPIRTTKETVIIEEQTVAVESYGEISGGFSEGEIDLEVGKTYKVDFDGVTYYCIAYNPTKEGYLDTDFVIIGNCTINADINMYGDDTGNGEPFGIGLNALFTATGGEYTVKVTAYEVKLDPNYLDMEAIKATLSTIELTATLEDGTTATYTLFGEVVTE